MDDDFGLVELFRKENFEEFRQKYITKMLVENNNKLLDDISNKNDTLIKKIISYRVREIPKERQNYWSVDRILENLKDNELLRYKFSISPIKQNIDENCQLLWLKDNQSIDTIKCNASIGPRLTLTGIFMENAKKSNNTTKTLDFYSKKLNLYTIAKYTNENGGSQDNQKNDVIMFINSIKLFFDKNKDSLLKFQFLLDGFYYNKEIVSSIRKLITKRFDKKIIITSCQEITSSL